MAQRPPKRKPKREVVKEPPSRFAASAFLKASPEAVQTLCDDLATLAAQRFSDLTGTTWEHTGQALAQQLRAAGHDLTGYEESPELQEWQATFYHPRGTFTFSLTFRAPAEVEVSWRTDDALFTARR
jgi:hypothetical protein